MGEDELLSLAVGRCMDNFSDGLRLEELMSNSSLKVFGQTSSVLRNNADESQHVVQPRPVCKDPP